MTQKLTKNISYVIHPFATSCRSIAMCGLYHKHNLLEWRTTIFCCVCELQYNLSSSTKWAGKSWWHWKLHWP